MTITAAEKVRIPRSVVPPCTGIRDGSHLDARRSADPDQGRRLLAAIDDGGSRTEAAAIGGVTLEVIRDWVSRFDARGPDGPIAMWLRLSHACDV
jgi:hypothetical protein